MSAIRAVLDSTKLFFLVLFMAGFLTLINAWPSSWWLDVRSINAGPARVGEPIPMRADRTINHAFLGRWTVTVRKWESEGWIAYCTATGKNDYRSGSELPEKLTLSWWTDGRCKTLDQGRYVISTIWEINPLSSFLPDKSVSIDSNIFEVKP